MPKICLVHTENPIDTSTWSGTSSRLINFFKQNSTFEIYTFHFGTNFVFFKYVFNVLQRLFKLNYKMFVLYNFFYGKYLEYYLKKSNINICLMLGHPLYIQFINRKNVDCKFILYCDSTYDIYLKNNKKYLKNHNSYFEKPIKKRFNSTFKMYDEIWVFSNIVKNNLIEISKINGENIYLAKPQVSVTLNDISINNKNYSFPYFIFSATHSFERKGGLLLLKAFQKFIVSHPNVKLIIEGGSINYYTIVKNFPLLKNNIIVLERLDRKSLFNIMKDSISLVLFSDAEPYGYIALESLLLGAPVIYYSKSAIYEICDGDKFGFPVEKFTYIDLFENLIKSYNDNSKKDIIKSEFFNFYKKHHNFKIP